jgi:hypothetical protein
MIRKLSGVILTTLLLAASVAAQTDSTVQLRDGSKVNGRIEELTGGTLYVRVSQHDQRQIPIGNVALIDRVGGASGLPATELREAAGEEHLLLLSNGSSVKGRLVAIRGGRGSAQENEPRTYVFQSTGRGEQNYPMDQVSRVYLGSYPSAAAAASSNDTSDLAAGAVTPGAIRVPANAGWVSTGMRVRSGERIAFNTSGEVQLSSNRSDRARSAGTTRTAPNSPIPTANAGALIGRIGNGQPFGIGDQTSVPMPDSGLLYLAVNDDEHSDNAGEFVVTMSRTRSRY